MLELIDQHDAERLVYRCLTCYAVGTSSPAQAGDGYFWDGAEKPGKWVRHVCAPVRAAPAAVAPTPRRRRATPEAAPPAAVLEPVPRKRGRPRKPTVT